MFLYLRLVPPLITRPPAGRSRKGIPNQEALGSHYQRQTVLRVSTILPRRRSRSMMVWQRGRRLTNFPSSLRTHALVRESLLCARCKLAAHRKVTKQPAALTDAPRRAEFGR